MKVILSLLIILIPAATPLEQLCAVVGQTKPNSSVPLKDLRNAPTEVVLDNRTLHLSALPWRDFMPGAWRPDGSPLMVGFRFTAADKKPLPRGVRVDRAWVLFGEEVWEVSDLRNRIKDQDHAEESWINCSHTPMCEITLRDGPK